MKSFVKYLLVIPSVACIMFVSACSDNKDNISEEQAIKIELNKKSTEPVYDVVDVMPEYNGGLEALADFIKSNVKYPEQAKSGKIQGKVFVKFVVGSDGEVNNAEIAQSIDPLLDAEALRVIKSLPKWTPGKKDGKNVAVNFTIPINFKLD